MAGATRGWGEKAKRYEMRNGPKTISRERRAVLPWEWRLGARQP